MKANLIMIFCCIFLGSCGQQQQQDNSPSQQGTVAEATTPVTPDKIITDCATVTFDSVQEQANYLKLYFKKAQRTGTNELYERHFFCAFPSSFIDMKKLFADGPLYLDPQGGDIIVHFQNLTTIPKPEYYDKYINICLYGIWEADHISGAFGFADKLFQDTAPACTALAQRKDSEIKSVFRFIFDGPHPDHEANQELYRKLLPLVTAHEKRLSRLLQQAFQELLAEDDGHGH